MNAMRSPGGYGQDGVPHELALNAQVPLLQIRRGVVGVGPVGLGGRRVGRGLVKKWKVKVGRLGLDGPGVESVRGIAIVTIRHDLVENSVTNTDRRLVILEGIPGEAD